MQVKKDEDRTSVFAEDAAIRTGPRDLGPLGAEVIDGGVRFRVWAPEADTVDLLLEGPEEGTVPMQREESGYFLLFLENAAPGQRYRYRQDGRDPLPDPASRHQPEGVHGPSRVWDGRRGTNGPERTFSGHAPADLLFYELHVGTFSPDSTFDGVLSRIDGLVDLGITALELMPVAQFPGDRNWGYDGVAPFAVQHSYGGPDGLRRLVDGCHARGLSVFLDVVYNHLGPEGNYLGAYGPYFSRTTTTPWGEALNFDEPGSDHVRHFFLENIRYFAEVFEVDGFRLDAIHAIRDQSAHSFLADVSMLAEKIALRRGRPLHLVAESNLNDRRTVLSREKDGSGFEAQWSDDFHHALHETLTGERQGYYADFSGADFSGVDSLARAMGEGFVYQGQYAPSFNHRRGSRSTDLPGAAFVFFAQNHDQVGNRPGGERLAALLSPDALRVAASLVILSPALPLLFMGEEYGETHPFLYFTSHGDADLIQAVRSGRAREFASFARDGELPDPQDPSSFERSRLSRELSASQQSLRTFTRALIALRKGCPAFACPDPIASPGNRVFCPAPGVVAALRKQLPGTPSSFRDETALVLWNLSSAPARLSGAFVPQEIPVPRRPARLLLDSRSPLWGGSGSRIPDLLTPASPGGLLLDAFHAVAFLWEGA